MLNVNNQSTLIGRLVKDCKFITNRDGREFAMINTIAVQRNYKNRDGEYDTDFIHIRLSGEKRMKYAHKYEKGDAVIIQGAIVTSPYTDKEGKKKTSFIIETESIKWQQGNPRKKSSQAAQVEDVPSSAETSKSIADSSDIGKQTSTDTGSSKATTTGWANADFGNLPFD